MLFIGNGGAYRRFQKRLEALGRISAFFNTPICVIMHIGVFRNAYMRPNAYRRCTETPICSIFIYNTAYRRFHQNAEMHVYIKIMHIGVSVKRLYALF